MSFKFKWERLSYADIERLTRVCNLEPIEKRLLELRCKGITPDVVADEIGYSRRGMFYLSNKVLEKILKEL